MGFVERSLRVVSNRFHADPKIRFGLVRASGSDSRPGCVRTDHIF